MQPSMFNVQVPLPERNEVFLMNTFSDAQILVSSDVPALLDRMAAGEHAGLSDEERETIEETGDVRRHQELRVGERVHQEHFIPIGHRNLQVED